MKNWMMIVVASLVSHVAYAGGPAWCKDAQKGGGDMADLTSNDASTVMKAFVSVSCFPSPETEAKKAEIDQARTAWSKRLGMSEADWADVVEWSKQNDYDIKPDQNMSTKEFTEMTPIDQWAAIKRADADVQGPMDAMYVADILDAKLSEAGRMAFLDFCIGSGGNDEILMAICQADADAFDPKKLFEQLKADTMHSGAIRHKLRLLGYEFPTKLKEFQDKAKQKKAADPGWGKAWFEADKARKEWPAIASANADVIALASKMESATLAHSRSMFEGCDDKTYAALAKATSNIAAKRFEKMRDIRDDPFKGFASKALPVALKNPTANLAAVSVVLCNARPNLAKVLSGALHEVPSIRGPRNFGISKMQDASIQLDDMSKKIYFPKLRHPYESGNYLSSAGAVIKSVKKDGDHLVVESQPIMVEFEDCVSEHTGPHIDRITDSGQVYYERICDKTAMKKHDMKWAPFKIDLKYEKVLKPGELFSATYGGNQVPADIIAVWASPNAAAPKWLLGGTLK
ncbi:MAG: hypothetical protein QM831_35760 [Kofleriaceae bacterium]